MGLGKSLKKLAGSGLSPVGSLMYKKDGSTREGFKSAAKVLSPAYALMSKDEEKEGAVGPTGRPQSRQGMISRLAAPGQSAEAGPMAGNRAMGVVNRAFRNGVRNNAPAAAADRPNQTMKKGGSVSARADGIAKKGKTKGRMV